MKAPTPTELAEKNIRAIYEREQAELKKVPCTHKVAHAIAAFSGTVWFAGLNALFFAAWIALNLTVTKFDPFPFTLLTLIVSLESIFLSTFVLLSQEELSKQSDSRNKLDLQVNLLAEQESTAIINVLIEIGRKQGVDEAKLKILEEMAADTDPTEMLNQIQKVEKEQAK